MFECDRVGGEFWWTNVFKLSTNAVQGPVVGNYTIEGTATSGAGANYAITFTNEAGNSTVAQYTIEKRVLIVSVEGFEVVYGESVDNGSIKLLYARKNGDGAAFYNDETDSVVNKIGIGFAYDYTACQTNAGTRVGVTVSGLSADNYAFEYISHHLVSITIPASVNALGSGLFDGCTSLARVTFHGTIGWAADGESIDVTDPERNVTYLMQTYGAFPWTRR